jgi:hypothetical protein
MSPAISPAHSQMSENEDVPDDAPYTIDYDWDTISDA